MGHQFANRLFLLSHLSTLSRQGFTTYLATNLRSGSIQQLFYHHLAISLRMADHPEQHNQSHRLLAERAEISPAASETYEDVEIHEGRAVSAPAVMNSYGHERFCAHALFL